MTIFSPVKITIFAILVLISLQPAIAVPAKKVVLDENIRLAMLDLARYNADISKNSNSKRLKLKQSSKKSAVSAQKKFQNGKKKTSSKNRFQHYPANCSKWSASQINQKAKRFIKPINQYAKRYAIDKDLVKAVVTVESCFKVKAKSKVGAQGLMQLIPATASRFGVTQSYNAKQNIRGGVKYLKFLKARYKGDLTKILAAYNAGEGAVDKYNGVPPYKETKAYVKKVLEIYARLNPKARRVSADYSVAKKGDKPGRHGWKYNKKLAPHLYKH